MNTKRKTQTLLCSGFFVFLAACPSPSEPSRSKPKNLSEAKWGKQVFRRAQCGKCHSVDGAPCAGGTLKGIWGSTRHFEDASTTKADKAYIKESILNPQARVVKGRPPLMPPIYQDQLNDAEVSALAAYIRSKK